LGRWNLVGELGSLLDYREPFTARIEREGEVLALPPDAIAAVLSDSPDVAHRLQRLALLTLASKLEKVSQTLASSWRGSAGRAVDIPSQDAAPARLMVP
jgi:CRP-like cAMP-binding protein